MKIQLSLISVGMNADTVSGSRHHVGQQSRVCKPYTPFTLYDSWQTVCRNCLCNSCTVWILHLTGTSAVAFTSCNCCTDSGQTVTRSVHTATVCKTRSADWSSNSPKNCQSLWNSATCTIRHYDAMMIFTCAWYAKVGLILWGSAFYLLGHLRELTQRTYVVSFIKWNDLTKSSAKGQTRTLNAWAGWTSIVREISGSVSHLIA